MRRTTVICIISAMVLSACFMYTSLGQADYQTYTGDYSAFEYTVYPEPTFPYPVINYSVSRDSSFVRLFDEIAIDEFRSGIPYQEAPTALTHSDDYGELIIHETPTTAIEFTALEDNRVELFLSEDTGALRSGQSVVVGNEDAKGYFIPKGDVNITITESRVAFDISQGSSLIFRADPEGEQVIGEATSNGKVGGEMYISNDAGYLIEDIVLYDELAMETISPGNREIDLKVSGELNYGQSVVVHVKKSMLIYESPEDIGIQLDEVYIEKGEGLSETLYEEGEEAKYFVTETDDSYDIVVYVPQISDHLITIGSVQEEIGIDGLATLLSAVAIVGIAAAALVYNRD